MTCLIQRLGVASVWFIIFVLFKITDRGLPWILVLGVTHAIVAYIILLRARRFPTAAGDHRERRRKSHARRHTANKASCDEIPSRRGESGDHHTPSTSIIMGP